MFKFRRSQLQVVLVLGACVALALPATALAQDSLSNPTDAQYHPQSQVQGATTNGSGGPSGPTASNTSAGGNAQGVSGTLPFTGMDLVVLAGTALTLIASGFVLRRLSAPRSPGV
jgi:hypothetical protein